MARELLSTYPTLCYKEFCVSPEIEVLPSGTLPQTLVSKKIRYDIDRRNVLSTKLDKGGRSERDKLDRRRSTELTIPPSCYGRPLVYDSDRQAVSTARFRRAGLLATADTNAGPH